MCNYIQLSWTKNLWNIMSNLYCSCKQILLIYPTDLFTSVIELTITQHSVWQYRIVRRSDLLQDQFNNRCLNYMYVYWVVPPKNSSTWVNNNKYMYFSNTQGHSLSIFGKYLFGWRFEIWNFRNICCKISCLPASPRIFEHLKNGIIAHF